MLLLVLRLHISSRRPTVRVDHAHAVLQRIRQKTDHGDLHPHASIQPICEWDVIRRISKRKSTSQKRDDVRRDPEHHHHEPDLGPEVQVVADLPDGLTSGSPPGPLCLRS